jgi:purine-binding chemotaxis protein CheW
VQEILLPQPLTRIPLAPPEVAGLLNLRGQIVPAIDLRRRLDMPARAAPEAATNVVLREEEGAVSLLVDAIGDILEVPAEALAPVPDNVRGSLRALLSGVHPLPGQLLLILSADAVLGASLAPAPSASLRSDPESSSWPAPPRSPP